MWERPGLYLIHWRARANGMGLLGEDISAKQAKEWGLIWDCVPDEELISEAEEIAKKLANGPITGLKEIVKAHDRLYLAL